LFNPKGGRSYFNIGIGSGYRGHPKNIMTSDRFYAIRDYNPYTSLASSAYTSKILDSQLDNITDNVYAATAPVLSTDTKGWKIVLNGSGEKVLSPSITLNGTAIFTSYIPVTTSSTTTCATTTGDARTYSIDIQDGTVKFESAFESHVISGLPSTTQVVNQSQLVSTSSPSSSSSSSSSSTPNNLGTCLSGLIVLNRCVEFGDRVKTFWKESGAN
jgi:type IV pilus assembly protein PilY1